MNSFYAYDHSRFRDWPEYREVARALDALAHRLDHEDDRLDLMGMERLAVEVAHHLRVSDCCPFCKGNGDFRLYAPFLVAPAAASNHVRGGYRCAAGHVWAQVWPQAAEVKAELLIEQAQNRRPHNRRKPS